jgi:mono/diheme cytochrome c family protein
MAEGPKGFDPDPGRLLGVFAALSLVFIGVLASAPLRPYFTEWREVQNRYNLLAARSGAAAIPVGIQQVWKPKLGIADRCVTCHLGMGTAAPLPGERLFRAHPPVFHDPRDLGCTLCHGGQGRATSLDAAHGLVSHWDEALLEPAHVEAGCGSCHDRAPLASRADLARGRHLVESLDCLSCHRVDGRGRAGGVDLSAAAVKGYRTDWYGHHLQELEKQASGPWRESFGEIDAADREAIGTFLRTRAGIPRVVEAQAAALDRGCLGCHRIGGRGGEEGPALDAAGRKPVGDLDFSRIPGERTLAGYMRRHLIDPAGVVAGSAMPPLVSGPEEADLVATFVMFLRGRELPAEFLPRARLRRQALGEPAPPFGGEQAYRAYCVACHGPRGAGRGWANAEMRFPAIGSPDFLGVASDGLLLATLENGRPGRKMPALGASGASLRPAESAAVVAYLRGLEPAAPPLEAVDRARAPIAVGREAYARDCAACHGDSGEGTPLGSPLATADSRVRGRREAAYRATVEGVVGTAMPRYRVYDAATLGALLDHLTTLPELPGTRATWRIGTGDAAAGEQLYERTCAGCHGREGAGRTGPALANPAFRKTADPAYIAATVVRGRSGTPMPAFGRDSAGFRRLAAPEVLDVTAYIARGLKPVTK